MVRQSVKFVYADWEQLLRGFQELVDLAQMVYSLKNIIVPSHTRDYTYAGDITYVFEWENAELMNEFWQLPRVLNITKTFTDGLPELVIINE